MEFRPFAPTRETARFRREDLANFIRKHGIRSTN